MIYIDCNIFSKIFKLALIYRSFQHFSHLKHARNTLVLQSQIFNYSLCQTVHPHIFKHNAKFRHCKVVLHVPNALSALLVTTTLLSHLTSMNFCQCLIKITSGKFVVSFTSSTSLRCIILHKILVHRILQTSS